MADASNTTVHCPNCQRLYQWRETVAGRSVRCKCGHVFVFPQHAGESVRSSPSDDWLESAPPLEASNDKHDLDFFSPVLNKPKSEGDFDFDSLYEQAPDAEPDRQTSEPGDRHRNAVELAESDQTIPLDVPASMKPADQQPSKKCPSCNSPMKPEAVICINCGFDQSEGGKIKTKVIDPDAQAKAHEDEQEVSASSGRYGRRPAQVEVPSELDAPAIDAQSDTSAVAQHYKSAVARALQQREDDATESRFADRYLPLIFFICGGGFLFMAGMQQDWSVAKTVAAIFTDLLVRVPLLVLAVFIAAKFMDISFGPLGKAVFKLASIAIGPLALADLLFILITAATMGYGVIVGYCIYIILAGVPLAYMFDLDYQDTAITVLSIILVRIFYPFIQAFFLAGFQ